MTLGLLKPCYTTSAHVITHHATPFVPYNTTPSLPSSPSSRVPGVAISRCLLSIFSVIAQRVSDVRAGVGSQRHAGMERFTGTYITRGRSQRIWRLKRLVGPLPPRCIMVFKSHLPHPPLKQLSCVLIISYTHRITIANKHPPV